MIIIIIFSENTKHKQSQLTDWPAV